jgi:uncharacterized paraquat-inducible protein A
MKTPTFKCRDCDTIYHVRGLCPRCGSQDEVLQRGSFPWWSLVKLLAVIALAIAAMAGAIVHLINYGT